MGEVKTSFQSPVKQRWTGQFPSPAADMTLKVSLKVKTNLEQKNSSGLECCHWDQSNWNIPHVKRRWQSKKSFCIFLRSVHRQYMSEHGGVIVNIIADMFRGFPMMAHTGKLSKRKWSRVERKWKLPKIKKQSRKEAKTFLSSQERQEPGWRIWPGLWQLSGLRRG